MVHPCFFPPCIPRIPWLTFPLPSLCFSQLHASSFISAYHPPARQFGYASYLIKAQWSVDHSVGPVPDRAFHTESTFSLHSSLGILNALKLSPLLHYFSMILCNHLFRNPLCALCYLCGSNSSSPLRASASPREATFLWTSQALSVILTSSRTKSGENRLLRSGNLAPSCGHSTSRDVTVGQVPDRAFTLVNI